MIDRYVLLLLVKSGNWVPRICLLAFGFQNLPIMRDILKHYNYTINAQKSQPVIYGSNILP